MKGLLTLVFMLTVATAVQAKTENVQSPPSNQVLEISVDNAATDGAAAEKAALDLMNDKTEKKAEIKDTATLSQVKESEIPVSLNGHQKSAGNESPFFKIILSLSVVGVLGCAAYFFFKKYVRTSGTQSNAKQIKILTQHYLGPKKSLAIIRVAGESILIGITEQNISLIKELSLLDEEIPETTPRSFGNLFERQTQTNNQVLFSGDEESKDEFSISGIKDFVATKMKNMRSLE